MKKLLTLVFALMLGVGLTFAQAGGTTDKKTTKTSKENTKTSKAHKGGKMSPAKTTPNKSKKATGTNNPQPK